MIGTQRGFVMIGRGNAEMLRSIAQDYDNRETALVALAEAFDAQWNAISGLEPESVVERRLYNAICKAIGLPPRCEDTCTCDAGGSAGCPSHDPAVEAAHKPKPTAVEEYAAWLERQPKPKTMAEALAQLPPGVGLVRVEVVHNAIAEALEDTQGLLAAMLLETRPAEEIEDQMVKNRAVLLTQAEIDKAMAGPQKPKGGSGDQR